MIQLKLNFAGYDEPNENGVYVGCESLVLQRKKGPPIVEVRIANTDVGYLYGVSLQFPTGGHCYMPKKSWCRPQSTRADAICGACAELLNWLSSNSYAKGAEASAARSWVNALGATA